MSHSTQSTMKHNDLRMRHDALADSSVMQDLCLSVADEFDRLAQKSADNAAKARPALARGRQAGERGAGTAASTVGGLFGWRRSRLAR